MFEAMTYGESEVTDSCNVKWSNVSYRSRGFFKNQRWFTSRPIKLRRIMPALHLRNSPVNERTELSSMQTKKQQLVKLVFWAQSTEKDYIRDKHKFHSIFRFFISQVIIPQVMFFEPNYIPRALNTGTCLRQGDLFYSAGLHRNHVLATTNTRKIGRGFGKNAGEWTGRVEISKEEIPGSKRSMYAYMLTYSRLSKENV